ncbi:MAG: flagellar biosynthetic protein FliR [Xanthomonadales bacterium]|nr:flagellar biosynthetic protein FliR [Xanthomonadales bacterium]
MIIPGLAQFDPIALIAQFMLMFVRVGAMMMATPIFRSTGIPTRVRLVMAVILAAAAMPTLPDDYQTPTMGSAMLPVILWEFGLGVAMGFMIQLVFAALAVAGEAVAMGMGLGFANMVDPQNGSSVPTMSQQFALLATILFVTINGHLLMLQMLYDSFALIPPGSRPFDAAQRSVLLEWGAVMYANALFLALPVLITMLLTNLAFGVITRAAPQLNVFAIGFPLMLIFGFVVVMINTEHLITGTQDLFEQAFLGVRRLISG